MLLSVLWQRPARKTKPWSLLVQVPVPRSELPILAHGCRPSSLLWSQYCPPTSAFSFSSTTSFVKRHISTHPPFPDLTVCPPPTAVWLCLHYSPQPVVFILRNTGDGVLASPDLTCQEHSTRDFSCYFKVISPLVSWDHPLVSSHLFGGPFFIPFVGSSFSTCPLNVGVLQSPV